MDKKIDKLTENLELFENKIEMMNVKIKILQSQVDYHAFALKIFSAIIILLSTIFFIMSIFLK